MSLAAAWVLLALAAPAARATQWMESTQSPVAESYADNSAHLLDLGSGTSFSFTTYAPATLAIYFTAECSVSGTNNQTWLDLDIVLDGSVTAPSNGDDAFCTDHANSFLANWVSGARDAVVGVGAGVHTIEVRGSLVGALPGDRWRIDDKSLLVVIQE